MRTLLCLVFCCLLFVGQVFAKDMENDLPQQPPVEGVSDLAWELQLKHPGFTVDIVEHYPQGICPAVDTALGEIAWSRLDASKTNILNGVKEAGNEQRKAISESLAQTGNNPAKDKSFGQFPWFSVTTYEVFKPSKDYVSVVFQNYSYSGGAHGNTSFDVKNFRISAGKPLELSSIFKDVAGTSKLLVPRIADGAQAQKQPGADPVARDAKTIDLRMERIALTAEGIRVYYAPYELGSYSEGTFIVDIPKQELVKMGADASIWTE